MVLLSSWAVTSIIYSGAHTNMHTQRHTLHTTKLPEKTIHNGSGSRLKKLWLIRMMTFWEEMGSPSYVYIQGSVYVCITIYTFLILRFKEECYFHLNFRWFKDKKDVLSIWFPICFCTQVTEMMLG